LADLARPAEPSDHFGRTARLAPEARWATQFKISGRRHQSTSSTACRGDKSSFK
jgi:hypothetical protein